MFHYIKNRLYQLIPILLGITLLCFAIIYTATGDVIDVMEANQGVVYTEATKAQMRSELGLDKPFIIQYGLWLKNILSGDMGNSFVSGQPVFSTFMSKLPATILLTFSSIICTVIISIPLGIFSSINKNNIFDYIIRCCSFVGNSIPGFFLSLLLIYIFSLKLNLFPVINNSININSLILPTMTLTIAMSAKYTRQVRIIVLDELTKEYVLAARSRGIKESVILYKSVLKVCMLSFITLLSLSIGSLLGGTAIIESIFLWDGVGKMAVDAIIMRDYPIILAYVIWMSIIYVFINLFTDILYHYLDPRIRLSSKD